MTGRWRVIPYSEYRAACPHHTLKCGVLEAFCCTAYLDSTLPSREQIRKRIWVPPRVLSRCTASCIQGALEKTPGLSLKDIRDLCSKSSAVIYNDGPDSKETVAPRGLVRGDPCSHSEGPN